MTALPRAVLVRGILDARAALTVARALGAAVTLASPPSGAASLGIGWWQALVQRLASEYPDVQFVTLLDCGARADLVQAALRQGLAADGRTHLCFRGSAASARRLADIAGQYGARLLRRPPQMLDPAGVCDPGRGLATWLSKSGPGPSAG